MLWKVLPEARAHNGSGVFHDCSNFPPKYYNMAASELSSKLSNLYLGEDNNETERQKHFWNRALIAMKFNLEPTWLDATWKAERKPNFGMRDLDAILEERCSFKLEIVGPLIDGYLGEIGKAFWAKLGRSKCTGLMPPIKLYIPYNIYRHISTMCVGYGADMSCIGKNSQQMVLRITGTETASKVFSPARFAGDNYLRKRLYCKVNKGGRNILQFSGKAAVVVGVNTPIQMDYSTKTEKVTVTFFV